MQAVEVKEGLKLNPDSVTQASVTFQCFFRYYERLAGMTVRFMFKNLYSVWHAGFRHAPLTITESTPIKLPSVLEAIRKALCFCTY